MLTSESNSINEEILKLEAETSSDLIKEENEQFINSKGESFDEIDSKTGESLTGLLDLSSLINHPDPWRNGHGVVMVF
jgi:hypothetical protein